MQRMLKFGSTKVPKLSKANLVNTEVHLLIQYIHQLLSQEAFDDLIDNETITLMGYVFAPTETASRNSITTHWTIDWDVATIIEALEELYPLQAEHKHLDFGTRWQQVVDRSVSRDRVQSDRIEQVRSDTIYEWSSGMSTIGPIPCNLQPRILTSLAQSFTHRDNPYGNSNPNIAFQRDLDDAMEADDEYRINPSLPRLYHLLAELAYKWEKIDPLPLSPPILGRRLLRPIVIGIATKPSRIPYRIPIAWDAIDLAICVRIVITRNIQTSIILDHGLDAGPMGNLGPEARQETRSS
jgi:hypothetical protein